METLENKIEMAFATPKISEVSDEDLLDFLAEQISEAYICVGYLRYEGNDIGLVALKLLQEIREHFSFLHQGELAIAFDMGLKGNFGPYNTVILFTFIKWLKDYRTCDFRFQVTMRENQKATVALPPVSRETREEDMKRFLIDNFQTYKATGNTKTLCSMVVYDYLEHFGFIHYTPEEKWAVMAKFKDWHPKNNMYVSDEARNAHIVYLCKEWIVIDFFDSISDLSFRQAA